MFYSSERWQSQIITNCVIQIGWNLTELPSGRNRLARRSYPMRNRDRGKDGLGTCEVISARARKILLSRWESPLYFHPSSAPDVPLEGSFKGRIFSVAFPTLLLLIPFVRSFAAVDIRCFDYKHGRAVCSARIAAIRGHTASVPPSSLPPFLHIE